MLFSYNIHDLFILEWIMYFSYFVINIVFQICTYNILALRGQDIHLRPYRFDHALMFCWRCFHIVQAQKEHIKILKFGNYNQSTCFNILDVFS